MICPKCSAETKVVSSRPHKDDARVIQRRRVCESCGHRFNTQEGTIDIARRRKTVRDEASKRRAKLNEAERAALAERQSDLRAARDQAAKNGGSPDNFLRAFGAAPRNLSRASALNPLAQR